MPPGTAPPTPPWAPPPGSRARWPPGCSCRGQWGGRVGGVRVIPCLDVEAGGVFKGVSFVGLRDAGDPVEVAARYDAEGAEELCFLDITASSEERDVLLHVVEAVAERVFIPLTVGGGVRQVNDVRRLLNAGADKVSINTAAVHNPQLVRDAADIVGCQCIVVAIDAKKSASGWEVYTHGGRKATGIDVVQWAQRMAQARAGGDPPSP